MTELIYLSHRKLLQFPPARYAPRNSSLSFELKLPLVGITVSREANAEPTDTRRLRRALADIEDRAVDYAAPGLTAGQWIFFELPMNFGALDEARVPSAVLFIDAQDTDDSRPRLLLHGASDHLVGSEPKAASLNAEAAAPTGSDGAASQAEFLYRFAYRLHALAAVGASGNAGDSLEQALTSGSPESGNELDPRSPTAAVPVDSTLGRAVRVAVELLDRRFDVATAARLVGYARVTGRFKESEAATIVTASPLFVGYSRQ